MRKLQRLDLVMSFFIAYVAVSLQWQNAWTSLQSLFAYSPILFFMFVMLTEPQTSPSAKKFRIIYGGLAGILLAPFVHVGTFYFAPESALIVANLFSYMVSSKQKLTLILKEKSKIAHNTFEFIFTPNKQLRFKSGQYLEWTLPHDNRDTRGLRRYFTIASSPTEEDIKLGVKFYENPSSFKQKLQSLKTGETITAGQLAGEFTLPNDQTKKLVFLAGGIGVTPFRSMIQYLIDNNERRNIIMLYANKEALDIAYKDIFEKARTNLHINTVYIQGAITKELLLQNVPDYKERIFYISGPKAMIDSFKKTLRELGVPWWHVKTDFFPGFA
jgi:ferredoxin-NADP reductase